MSIGIIIIGDEVLLGRTQDTNTSWLGRYLFSQGLSLSLALTVGDDPQAIKDALNFMLKKVQLAVTSGGLGPTRDDITKQVLAEFFDAPLEENTKACEIVKKNYERHGKSWDSKSNNYHLIPRKFIPLNNPLGLAPGLAFKRDEKLILSAPGVPKEFQAMASKEFLSYLPRTSSKRSPNNRKIIIRTSFIQEEEIFYTITPKLWDRLSTFGKVSSLPNSTGVDILVMLRDRGNLASESEKEIRQLLEHSPLQKYIWSWQDRRLEEIIVEKAQEKALTFCFAESCTGGLAASRITDVPGSSTVFMGSFVTYANNLKTNVLSVSSKTLSNTGAVSVSTVNEMAQAARKLSHAHAAISFSGIAGPSGGSIEKPIGTVAISLATNQDVCGKLYRFQGDRSRLKQNFSQMGLLLLLRWIQNS